MKDTFDFTAQIKKYLFIMMGIGFVGILWILASEFITGEHNHHSRLWSNILANTYYFTGIGLFGMFVVAAAQIAYGGWQTLVKRILLSLSAFAAFGGFALFLILLLGYLGVHNLYEHVFHILKTGAGNPKYTTKLVFFAPAFWLTRVFIYAILWFFSSRVLNNFFARTDQTDPKVYKRSKLLAAAFIVIFALTESFISWDMIMSMDPHWYSTLFGWYNFASYGCAAWGMTILLVIFLKSQGYLPQVNENHVHDLGKMLFGFSIFWTYLWFDQFMLQWYANVPEDTMFWVKRFDVDYFKLTVFGALIINFLFPLFVLIKRSAKRNYKLIAFGAALLVFGHYVDFFNFTFVEPNWNEAAVAEAHESKEAKLKANTTVLFAEAAEHKAEGTVTDVTPTKENTEAVATEVKAKEGEKKEGKEEEEAAPSKTFASIGLGEIMVFIGFLGIFLYLFFNNLAKRPIVPENDPYLKECERLEVTYS